MAESGSSGQPVVGTPNGGGLGRVLSNQVETSNVDLGLEMVELTIAQRGFEMNMAVLRAQDEILGTLLDIHN